MKHEAQVVLYRSYRRGDLPDIQIPHSSLITPLQAVAQVSMEPAHTLGLLPLTGSKGDLSLTRASVLSFIPSPGSQGPRRGVLSSTLLWAQCLCVPVTLQSFSHQ